MNDQLFERLLYEEESSTLDFKKEQYLFVKASEEEKSELLKDILGFANAWRRAEAYILTGVEDVRGDRGIVHCIAPAEHLNDHALQQFVSNLTNRPVRFAYEAFGFEGKQVGVIRIEEQARPIYLKRAYGKLQAEKVYIRRGSSTDPTKPATPEEIASMGQRHESEAAELSLEFADTVRDDSLGTHISLDAEYCEMPSEPSIPNFQYQVDHPWAQSFGALQINPAYLRQLARYEHANRLCRPIRLVIRNVGKVPAHSVRIEITIPASAKTWVGQKLPSPPKRESDFLLGRVADSLRETQPTDGVPGDVAIDRNDHRTRLEVDCGNLQPGRRIWSEIFYVGKAASGELVLAAQVFADNLPQPNDFNLVITANVRKTRMTVTDLRGGRGRSRVGGS